MSHKQQIISQFAEFIEAAPDEAIDQTNESTDLFSLFQELSVLKNEVKTESRQVKTALDEFKSVFSSLNANQSYLQQAIDTKQQQLDQQHSQLLKPLLLSLVEFYDRLNLSIKAMDTPEPTGLLARFKRPLWQKLQTIKQGQEITLRQLQRVLDEYQVEPINSLGQPYDPSLMKVVATAVDPDVANNMVTGETVKGFLWRDQLMRLAEVKVNKQENAHV